MKVYHISAKFACFTNNSHQAYILTHLNIHHIIKHQIKGKQLSKMNKHYQNAQPHTITIITGKVSSPGLRRFRFHYIT
jgi:hypothetical protein